jgi:Zn-finger nucleic acid-binding protein
MTAVSKSDFFSCLALGVIKQSRIHMLCPSCQAPLVTKMRYEVEIDFCPRCRGVWLDRGELDKIIAHSMRHHEEESAQLADAASRPLKAGERRHVYPPTNARRRFMLEQYFDF